METVDGTRMKNILPFRLFKSSFVRKFENNFLAIFFSLLSIPRFLTRLKVKFLETTFCFFFKTEMLWNSCSSSLYFDLYFSCPFCCCCYCFSASNSLNRGLSLLFSSLVFPLLLSFSFFFPILSFRNRDTKLHYFKRKFLDWTYQFTLPDLTRCYSSI